MKPVWATAGRTGPVRDYVDLKVFACEGLVVIIDERPGKTEGEYSVVTPTELEHRIKEINQPYRNQGRMDLPAWKRQEYDKQKAGSQNCLECVKEARYMGDPSDPKVQLFWATQRRRSKVRISFSAGSDPAGYPQLPDVSLGKMTGRMAAIDHELLTQQIIISENYIHVPPKPKRRGLILLDI